MGASPTDNLVYIESVVKNLLVKGLVLTIGVSLRIMKLHT